MQRKYKKKWKGAGKAKEGSVHIHVNAVQKEGGSGQVENFLYSLVKSEVEHCLTGHKIQSDCEEND